MTKADYAQYGGCITCAGYIKCSTCNECKHKDEIEENTSCFVCNQALKCSVCEVIVTAEILAENGGKCMLHNGNRVCQECRATYKLSFFEGTEYGDRARCPACLGLQFCQGCHGLVANSTWNTLRGYCKKCYGYTECRVCNRLFAKNELAESNGKCRECTEVASCMKCNAKVHISKIKQPNGFCDSCNSHSCDVCFEYGVVVTKKECQHFECNNCEIASPNCSRCKQIYKCKVHAGYITVMSADHFLTKCCNKSICIYCRAEIKYPHQCQQYVRKIFNL